jgi:group I intron endonuclease
MENLNNYKVYKHTNSINGKVYIGITQQELKDRTKSGWGYTRNKHFFAAIKKYGWNSFDSEIIEESLALSDALTKETYYINMYKTFDKSRGYNKTLGGENPLILNEEVKAEYSERMKKINLSRKGRPLSDEHKKKISASLTGRKFPNRGKGHLVSNKTKEKISKANTGKKRTESAIEKNRISHTGIIMKQETKRKISERMKNIKGKKVIGYNIETGDKTKVFNSVQEAAEFFNLVNSSCITNCCRGRTKSSAGHI